VRGGGKLGFILLRNDNTRFNGSILMTSLSSNIVLVKLVKYPFIILLHRASSGAKTIFLPPLRAVVKVTTMLLSFLTVPWDYSGER
jgi:hypothetical protein